MSFAIKEGEKDKGEASSDDEDRVAEDAEEDDDESVDPRLVPDIVSSTTPLSPPQPVRK